MPQCVKQLLVHGSGRLTLGLPPCGIAAESLLLFSGMDEFVVAIGEFKRAQVKLETLGDGMAIALITLPGQGSL